MNESVRSCARHERRLSNRIFVRRTSKVGKPACPSKRHSRPGQRRPPVMVPCAPTSYKGPASRAQGLSVIDTDKGTQAFITHTQRTSVWAHTAAHRTIMSENGCVTRRVAIHRPLTHGVFLPTHGARLPRLPSRYAHLSLSLSLSLSFTHTHKTHTHVLVYVCACIHTFIDIYVHIHL